ncbi:diaminopimelate epimerase [Puniceicoccales bacterium CK1056]|uniref:Diaminopimelate epimerase n=1 Tax=Oceanipulchritudo coccoides TaxID=2706888 RepID=A0A6B2M786_9BACT|nr:diaminopimelate epimerase [Oceanipulchritudo coccoides]NDV63490.1 diaminopimelate epimerase [Oceanipulchritudo coccoides]
MHYSKYHALGNDYLVLDPKDCPELPSENDIRTICHRNFGLGSDGILYGPIETDNADFGLRILNPDGSEAEKSGNGLRIFARYLRDTGRVTTASFTVETLGGIVSCEVNKDASSITVEMGKVSFEAAVIPVNEIEGEVVDKEIELEGTTYRMYAATIGNPHCVLPMEEISSKTAHTLGPIIENHPLFPNRTNVQFLKIIDDHTIQIEIWERGAGYTLASGSSSSAAGAVARRMGCVGPDITVNMPGGQIQLHIDDDFSVRMTGPATRVGSFELDMEALG